MKIWQSLKTNEAANKTVELLCMVEDDTDFLRRLIKTYLKWVIEENPNIGLDFLTGKYPTHLNYSDQKASEKVILIQEALSLEETL
jgi:hypothetical protein